jgi:hypothetical protein
VGQRTPGRFCVRDDGDHMTKLSLDDITDLRAYEREREAFRQHVIDLKRRRRVQVGEIVTFLFENRDTVRFQIQEMARVEKLISDDAIEAELRTYNPLIPDAGQLSATMFIELTSKDDLMMWLPKLVGIERHALLRVGDDAIRAVVEEEHAEQLTRDDVTASVHYVRWELRPDQVERVAAEPVWLAIDHPAHTHEVPLRADTVRELLADLRGG